MAARGKIVAVDPAPKAPRFRVVCDRVFGKSGITEIEVEGDKIAGVRQISRVVAGKLPTYDARGHTIIPGFIDSHVHAIATGLTETAGSLRGVTTEDALVAKMRERWSGKGRLNRFAHFDLSVYKGDAPDGPWLDDEFDDAPAMVLLIEGHSAFVNSAAARMIGLPKAALSSGGRPGLVAGAHYETLIDRVYSKITRAEKMDALETVTRIAVAQGVTTIHCLEGYADNPRDDFEAVVAYAKRSPIDLVLYPQTMDPTLPVQLGLTRLGGCILLDGAIGARTAAVSKPYADTSRSNRGNLYMDDCEVYEWMRAGLANKLQPCVHAIGERAIGQALRVLAKLADEFDLARVRPRVEHFTLPSSRHISQAAALHVASGMQPAFDHFWGGCGKKYAQALGEARSARTNPVGILHRAGILVGGGSDSNVTPISPLLGIHSAVNHSNPAYRVTLPTAIRMFTEHGARLAHEERRKGRIAEGLQADLAVIDGDFISRSSPQLKDARVLATIARGAFVYGSLTKLK